MKIGALIVTTGLSKVSGVTALLSPAGAISAGQRIISTFQCAGVALVGLVVGPENKKSERQLAQSGTVFLRCDADTSFFAGLQKGLSFMQGKFDRVFVVPGDIPMFFPSTLQAMLESTASMVIPQYNAEPGYPLLLDARAMELLLAQKDLSAAREAIRRGALPLEAVAVEDPGILLRGGNLSRRKGLIRSHNSQLTRPSVEVMLCNGGTLYDSRLALLLHLVEDTHSVLDACSMMQISYSAAWNMLNHVEEELGFPLVKRIRGGSAGSGSVLTEKGRALMHAYDRFSAHMDQTVKELYQEFLAPLAETI